MSGIDAIEPLPHTHGAHKLTWNDAPRRMLEYIYLYLCELCIYSQVGGLDVLCC